MGAGRVRADEGQRSLSTQLRWLSVILLLACSAAMCAQGDTPASAEGNGGYTLHVYENLVQIPALVLTSGHESYRGLTPARFAIQIDGGPSFHPKEAHLEGNDPISLSVLLDAKRGDGGDLVKAVVPAVGRLRNDVLTPKDHVSVFAFDCTLVRTVDDAQANASVLKTGVAEALASPKLHGSEPGTRCGKPLELWDAVATVAQRMAHVPGRRVLVVVSDGNDHGSRNSVDGVRQFTTGLSLAIFGIRPSLPPGPVAGSSIPAPLLGEAAMNGGFGQLCNGTGGLLLGSSPDAGSVASTVERVIRLLRGRYILEFARPQNGTAGMHLIEVTTSDVSALVRTSGVIVPIEDKTSAADLHTVHKDTSHDPMLGSHQSTVAKP